VKAGLRSTTGYSGVVDAVMSVFIAVAAAGGDGRFGHATDWTEVSRLSSVLRFFYFDLLKKSRNEYDRNLFLTLARQKRDSPCAHR
jgi:hypothetical protein